MNEKEIAKPVRKRKSSDTEKKAATKKTRKTAKAVTPDKKAEAKDFVIDSVGELKPARKKASKKPLSAPVAETATELADVAGRKLAEAVQTVEEVTENSLPKVKAPRKRAAAKKAKTDAPSSDTVVKKAAKKTVSKAKKEKTLETKVETIAETEEVSVAKTVSQTASEQEMSPVFKELSEPKLPELSQENRAWLQLQSPNRIFFYWTIKQNPFETLNRAFPSGRAQDYKLSIKLVNLDTKAEEVHQAEKSGSWWFGVSPNTSYCAEVGFFSSHRPFVRLMYSNTIETPRAEPSPNQDWSTDFSVSANQFAEVLGASGYSQDALEVAMTGDDPENSDAATRNAFLSLGGDENVEFELSELRSALLALAAGASLDSLRSWLSPKLFAQLEAILRENAERLSAERVRVVLKENFALEDEKEEFLTPVFGASEIHFPRKAGKPKLPKVSPVSSLRKTV